MRLMYLLPFVPARHSLVRLLALGLYKTPSSASNKAVAVNTCVGSGLHAAPSALPDLGLCALLVGMATQRGAETWHGSSVSGLKLLSVTVAPIAKASKDIAKGSYPEISCARRPGSMCGFAACTPQLASPDRNSRWTSQGLNASAADGRSAGGRSLQVYSKPCLSAYALQHSRQTACSHTRPMATTVAGCKSTLHAPVTLLQRLHSRRATPSPHQQQNALHPVSVHALQAPYTTTARQPLLTRCEQPTPSLCNACCLWRHQPAAPDGVACADAQQRSDATLTQANSNSRSRGTAAAGGQGNYKAASHDSEGCLAWQPAPRHNSNDNKGSMLPAWFDLTRMLSRQQQHYGRSANCKAWVAAHTL